MVFRPQPYSDRELVAQRSKHLPRTCKRSRRAGHAFWRTSVTEDRRPAGTHKHGINDILIESLEAEETGLALYRELYELVRDRSVLLEDYARRMIAEEELHVGEVNKMLRKPGEITQFQA